MSVQTRPCSEYLRFDCHLHTWSDKEFTYNIDNQNIHNTPENEPIYGKDFYQKYINALKQANIRIGVITNHNKLNVKEYNDLAEEAQKEGILLLPGVELSVKEGARGIHLLIVFNPDDENTKKNNFRAVTDFLSYAFRGVDDYENSNQKCGLDLKHTLIELNASKLDYFCIFAHVFEDSGLFEECQQGIFTTFVNIPGIQEHIIGLQKAQDLDFHSDKSEESRIDHAQACKQNLFKDVFHNTPLALVEGSDPKNIDKIGKGHACYLKTGVLSFNAVKFALQHHQQRVFSHPQEIQHTYIESLSFTGGKLDGQRIKFSPELNTFIGSRGSGKSSLLELIRYIFDLPSQEDAHYKNDLIENVFGSGGTATLNLVDAIQTPPSRWQIRKVFNQKAQVFLEKGDKQNPTFENIDIAPLSLVKGIQYFGQKDLASSASHEQYFLDSLLTDRTEIQKHEQELHSTILSLTTLCTQLIDLRTLAEEQEDVEHKQKEVNTNIQRLNGLQLKEKLQQSQYESDKIKLESTQQKLHELCGKLTRTINQQIPACEFLNPECYADNIELFQNAATICNEITEKQKNISEAVDFIKNKIDEFANIQQLLDEKITAKQDDFAQQKLAVHKQYSVNVETFLALQKESDSLAEQERNLKSKAKHQQDVKDLFRKEAKRRQELLKKQYSVYKTTIGDVQKKQDFISIETEFAKKKEDFKERLKNDFRGVGLTDDKYQKIADTFQDYVDLLQDWLLDDGERLHTLLKKSSEYAKFELKLQNQYTQLIEYRTPNLITITNTSNELKTYSLGQRASLLISFLLNQDNNSILIIDQPEDDLDNQTLYTQIIQKILEKKQKTQFIFASHNANIPVLGDAEQICTVSYKEGKIKLSPGNIDSPKTQKNIINIMEGGKEAFQLRKNIYTHWSR